MEIKTCEQYVLAELTRQCDINMALEQENKLLRKYVTDLEAMIKELQEREGINNGTDDISG